MARDLFRITVDDIAALKPGANSIPAALLLSELGLTYTRAGVAHGVDPDGLIYEAPADELRLTHYDLDGDGIFEERAVLIEPARTNGWATFTNDYENAAWTKVEGTTISSGATTAPDGVAASADKIIESPAASGNVAHGVERTFAGATDNTRSSASALFKADERAFAYAELTRKDGTTVTVWFNLSTAAKGTVEAGLDGFVRGFPDGYVWVSIAGDVLSGGTTPNVRWGIATADNTKAYTGDGASGLFLWESAVEVDKPFPSEPGSILPNGLARAADALTQSVAFGPGNDLTVYAEMVRPVHADAGASVDIGTFPGVFFIGGTTTDRLAIFFRSVTRELTAEVVGDVSKSVNRSVPAGSIIRLAAQYKNLTTGGQVALDVNDGSGYTAFSAATAAMSQFSNQTLRIGGSSFSGRQLSGGLISLASVDALVTLDASSEPAPFTTLTPVEVTEPEIPGPLISKAQSGRVNTRATQQIGRTWTERYLLRVRDAVDRRFLARVREAWREGEIVSKSHVDYATTKGVGGGAPRVRGASQTGATLEVDGAPASTAGWLLAGDIIRVEGLPQSFALTEDADSGSDGRAFLRLDTPLFEGGSPADNALITIADVELDVVVLEPPVWPDTDADDFSTLELTLSEAL